MTGSSNLPLLCAYCGHPVPIVDHVTHACRGQRIVWHHDCYEDDEIPTMQSWEEKVAAVELRGPRRVGYAEVTP